MTATVTNVGATPDPTYGSAQSHTAPNAQAPAAQALAASPQPAASAPNADLRLVIEDDQKAGCFVYKTIDWRTGEVVQQIPREQILRMREASDYAAGAVVDTSA